MTFQVGVRQRMVLLGLGAISSEPRAISFYHTVEAAGALPLWMECKH